MIAFALAYCSSPHTEAVTPRWSELTNVLYLADRLDAPGIVAVTTDSKAHVLDGQGKTEDVYNVPENSRVLRHGKYSFNGESYIVTSRGLVDIVSNTDLRTLTKLTFGQGENTVIMGQGCAVFTERAVFSPSMGFFDAIAVRNDGESIVVIKSPMGVPILTTYSHNGTKWSESADQLSPMIEDVGFAGHLDRFSDLRFIDDNKLIYIGTIKTLSPLDQSRLPDPLIQNGSLEIEKDGNLSIFLFAFDQRSWMTAPIVAGVVNNNGERGGLRFGQFAVSNDLSCAYVICWDGIARVDLSVLKDWP